MPLIKTLTWLSLNPGYFRCSLRIRVCSFGFAVSGLQFEFAVWSLQFRVWSFEFAVIFVWGSFSWLKKIWILAPEGRHNNTRCL